MTLPGGAAVLITFQENSTPNAVTGKQYRMDVLRFELPNLRALNFVIVGILGEGVASSVRVDAQAKGLGEYLRSRVVDVPVSMLPTR